MEEQEIKSFFKLNRSEIVSALPHGSIRIISNALGISYPTVNRVFINGWTPEHHAECCRRAFLIIEAATSPHDKIRADLTRRYYEMRYADFADNLNVVPQTD